MGFFAKQQVLLASLSVGFIFLSLIAINTSVIAAFYYLKLIQVSSFINKDLSLSLQNNLSKNTKLAETLPKGAGQGISKTFFNSNIQGLLTPLLPTYGTEGVKGLTPFNLSLTNAKTDTVLTLTGVEALKINNLNYRFSHIHSYLISILTCMILLYAIKPNLMLNFTSILAFYAFSL